MLHAKRRVVHQRGIKPLPIPQVPARAGTTAEYAQPGFMGALSLQVVASQTVSYQSKLGGKLPKSSRPSPATARRTQLMLHAQEAHHNASAGNRARVTSMVTIYSTTRPLMPS